MPIPNLEPICSKNKTSDPFTKFHQASKLFFFHFRREHAEELEDLVDVVNDLKNKDEEVAQLKSFQEVQAAELTKVRKDFHKLERDSKDTLEKSEYEIKKDIQTVNTKV